VSGRNRSEGRQLTDAAAGRRLARPRPAGAAPPR
jgi:hypothetical protein